MLTIENITKVYKKDIGMWRIGRVETINTAYLFTLVNPVGNRIQINLERNPIGLQYELWFWEDDSGSAKPIRRLLRKCDFELGPSYVIKNIENMMNLK